MASGAYVVMNPPYAASIARLATSSAASAPTGSARRRSPSSSSEVAARPGEGRKSVPTRATALVIATSTNGARSPPIAAAKPPNAGPVTVPADWAAEMMPLANARRAGTMDCAR